MPGSDLTGLFREAGHPLLMPYAVGGYPDPAGCLEIVRCYMRNGADLVELGIPFSDPLADGPVIQEASQVALRSGIRPLDVLELAKTLASEGAQVVLLSYLNNVLAFGPGRFFERCRDCGVLGVVVPDLPVEEAAELQTMAGGRGISLIMLAAPTSTEDRLARIAAAASGFIYCVSTTGVTGARGSLPANLPDFVARIRRHTELPLAVGFGVSTVEQAERIAGYADGVIVGSALVRMVAENKDLAAGLGEIERYLQEVRSTPSFSR